ncbi:Ig-like domain-containing protein [Sulfurovum sp.]|uniref:Ig-like domain-containing protein n=1 Tax=Sulfurovum sp. TaxID=1969726 RepID=UPI00356538A3
MKHFLVLLLIITGSISLYGTDDDLSISKGTDQDVIVQLSPTVAQTDVWNNAKIEVRFTVPIDASSVQKNNIKLTHLSSKTNEHIDGTIDYDKFDNKVVYTPNALLSEGVYEVEIKSLKADKAYKTTQINEIKYRFNVPEVINGHQLPPEPDPTINDSTLLGIDANENGVRDDVEIWILNKYRDKHPIHIDIAMQAARAYKKVLETPERAREIHDEVRKARHCEFYYKYDAKYFNEPLLVENDFDTKYLRKKIYFNTEERKNAYTQYDTLLSGDSYALPKKEDEKKACDFNTSRYEK